MARLFWFILGAVVAVVAIFIAGYGFIVRGGVQMAVDAQPLPLEEKVADLAITASMHGADQQANPLKLTDDNLNAGVQVYNSHCAGCHGVPGKQSGVVKRIAPSPPQLFEHDQMVTDDPEGATYWVVTNGIRLSGMPQFKDSLTDDERWQVTMLLSHADKIPPAISDLLGKR
ncbi:MAG TPA: cytochrome c [Candidatus Binataceae bacterium]|nr:cytochrome c [Candidatus Binataceae bacterium]